MMTNKFCDNVSRRGGGGRISAKPPVEQQNGIPSCSSEEWRTRLRQIFAWRWHNRLSVPPSVDRGGVSRKCYVRAGAMSWPRESRHLGPQILGGRPVPTNIRWEQNAHSAASDCNTPGRLPPAPVWREPLSLSGFGGFCASLYTLFSKNTFSLSHPLPRSITRPLFRIFLVAHDSSFFNLF